MNKSGPIVVIEDDPGDQSRIGNCFSTINCTNEIIYFSNGEDALEYFTTTTVQPFFILSELDLPLLSGLALLEKIRSNEKLTLLCVPFLFFSASSSPEDILQAYLQGAHGYFRKSVDPAHWEFTIKTMVEYWEDSLTPAITSLAGR